MPVKRSLQRLPPSSRKSRYLMVNVTLSPELDEFLQNVGNESRRTGGYKLPKTMILRGLARVLQELIEDGRIDLSGVRSEDEFVSHLREAFGKRKK